MKKVVSLLVALAIAVTITSSAFAATDDITGAGGSRALLSDPSTRITYGTSGADSVSFSAGELLLVENNPTRAIITPETPLEPGTEYEFRIYRAVASFNDDPTNITNEIVELTDGDLGNGGKLRLRGIKGTSAVSSAKINKKGTGNNATYRLVLNTKENWGTKETDTEYTLSVTGVNADNFADTSTLSFKIGWGRYTDEEIDQFGEGDTITINNDQPIILKKQFTEIAKVNNYKAVQFEAEDGAWSYLGRVSGMGDTNFRYTHDVIPAIVEKFEDQEFEFLTFGAGVNFPANGEMRIDVADISDEYGRIYTYLYRNGMLTPISTTFDSGADEIVFRTNYLGSFVMTDRQITDTTIIDTDGGEEPGEGSDNNGGGSSGNNGDNENPDTGANSAVNLAVALAVASIAVAGATRKRG